MQKKTARKRLIVSLFCALLILALSVWQAFQFASEATPVRADSINDTDFVITVKTDMPGTTASGRFRIPRLGSGYNYTVDCNNDGVLEVTGRTSIYDCLYDTPGTYTIRIGGSFPRAYFRGGDGKKIIQVNQWGDQVWTNMEQAFYDASNVDVVAQDTPNLSKVRV